MQFEKSAEYYDLIYSQKDYDAETQYVFKTLGSNHIPSILDIGCGTGNHLAHYISATDHIHAIDTSNDMINIARQKYKGINGEKLVFEVADALDFASPCQYSHIQALFHVVNYFGDRIEKFIENISTTILQNGSICFDFWHLPAILKSPPREVHKQWSNDNLIVKRHTTPVVYLENPYIDVNFDFTVTNNTGHCYGFHETHRMHPLSRSMISAALLQNGFKDPKFYKWMSFDPLCDDDWFGYCVARKR